MSVDDFDGQLSQNCADEFERKLNLNCDDDFEKQLRHECGVFGCIAADPWPTNTDVAQVICLGLLALQHR